MTNVREHDEAMSRDFAFRVTGRRIMCIGSFLAFLPAAVLGALLGSEALALILSGGCAVVAVISSIVLAFMQCPRCRRPLFINERVNKMAMFTLQECKDCGFSFASWEVAAK